MYSLGILGSCLPKIFFNPINLRKTETKDCIKLQITAGQKWIGIYVD